MARALVFRAELQKPLTYADFDTRVLKKNFRTVGAEVRKIARRLVSRRAVSKAGEFPGMNTGTLRKSIKSKVSRSGFSVGISSYKIEGMDVYYPAFVYYGHRRRGADQVNGVPDRKQRGRKRVGEKVAKPRRNYIVEAAERYGQSRYQAVMQKVLVDAIKPGVITG